jgi:hypothetical protein
LVEETFWKTASDDCVAAADAVTVWTAPFLVVVVYMAEAA